MTAAVVLVHGSMHGSWCWERVVRGLEERGVPALAVDLPGRGANRNRPRGAAEDMAVVLEAIAAAGGPVVICGHSAAGPAISFAAAASDAVRRLVYLAALMPVEDEELAAFLEGTGARFGRQMRFSDGTLMVAGLEAATELMYHDCTPEDARWAYDRLVPEPINHGEEGGSTPIAVAPWETIPTTYVVCADDRGFPPELQRHLAARAQTVVEWPTGHSPFVSRPELVVDLLAGLVGEVEAESESTSLPA